MSFVRAALAAVMVCALPPIAPAQPAAARQAQTPTIAGGRETERPSRMAAPATATSSSAAAPKTHRWLDLQIGQVDARYRVIDTSAGVRSASQLQHKQTIRAGVKFDANGRYSLQTGLGTGNSFTASWEPTGIGTGEPAWAFNVRTLYLAAQPMKGLEIHVGSLPATLRGESSEITAYDNDGFLVGERVTIRRANELWLDEVAATVGYLGDFSTPNAFRRLDSLDDHNYTQVLAVKRLWSRGAASVDWTRVDGVETWREAVRVATGDTKVVDSVRLELYQRAAAPDGEGFAISLDKAVSKQVSLTGGYATIDRAAPLLNGDRYGRGRRVFVEGRVAVTPELSVSVFYTHAVANDFPIANDTRFDLVVSYNVLRALQRAGAW